MRNTSGLKKLFHKDRKTLCIILSIVIFSVLTLTVVYSALSTTLNINGNAEVSAASWDIYLDNVQLNSRSATQNVPTISNKTTASFSTMLSKPGDFYEFTIDIVNNGSIDAMIDSVTKTPTLTTTQAKYLNYIVEYQNGEVITTKQLVAKNSYVRLKVKLEFRKDITVSDLPTTSETLNLSFRVNYVHSDENGTMVPNNGERILKVLTGNLETVGSEVAIGDEHFYIISSHEDSVTMLAKYNLYVGLECPGSTYLTCTEYRDKATGLQDSTMIGYGTTPQKGTVKFSQYPSSLTNYPAYVYDSNSIIYEYVENYKTYLESQGAEIEEARLIKLKELEALGCSRETNSCNEAPEWIYTTSYWSGEANNSQNIWVVYSSGVLETENYTHVFYNGVRPVITISL